MESMHDKPLTYANSSKFMHNAGSQNQKFYYTPKNKSILQAQKSGSRADFSNNDERSSYFKSMGSEYASPANYNMNVNVNMRQKNPDSRILSENNDRVSIPSAFTPGTPSDFRVFK